MQKLIKLGMVFWVLTLAAPSSSAEVDLLFSMVERLQSHQWMVPQTRRENIAEELQEIINGAISRVFIAIYSITHEDIAAAIINAKNKVITDAKTGRGEKVEIKVIVDRKAMRDEAGNFLWRIQDLVDARINIRAFNPSKAGSSDGSMHNKYAIIDDIFWTGSFNFTKAAQNKNQENVVIIKDSQELIEQALHNFNILWECSESPLPPPLSQDDLVDDERSAERKSNGSPHNTKLHQAKRPRNAE